MGPPSREGDHGNPDLEDFAIAQAGGGAKGGKERPCQRDHHPHRLRQGDQGLAGRHRDQGLGTVEGPLRPGHVLQRFQVVHGLGRAGAAHLLAGHQPGTAVGPLGAGEDSASSIGGQVGAGDPRRFSLGHGRQGGRDRRCDTTGATPCAAGGGRFGIFQAEHKLDHQGWCGLHQIALASGSHGRHFLQSIGSTSVLTGLEMSTQHLKKERS